MSEFIKRMQLERVLAEAPTGLGRPDPQQRHVKKPFQFIGIAGMSLSLGRWQQVYVDGNDTDFENPTPTGLIKADAYPSTYDEGNNQWNRVRGNYHETLLASAARTANVLTDHLDNFNSKGGHFIIDVTAIAGGAVLTPTIYGVNPTVGNNYVLLNDPAGGAPFTIVATGVYVMKIYPGIAPVANLSANDTLPRYFQFGVNQAVGTATYSVSFNQVI